MLYYVKEWSESAKGGASMLHAEYLTYEPAHLPGERRERQSEDDGSGWSCSRVELVLPGEEKIYDDLPFYKS